MVCRCRLCARAYLSECADWYRMEVKMPSFKTGIWASAEKLQIHAETVTAVFDSADILLYGPIFFILQDVIYRADFLSSPLSLMWLHTFMRQRLIIILHGKRMKRGFWGGFEKFILFEFVLCPWDREAESERRGEMEDWLILCLKSLSPSPRKPQAYVTVSLSVGRGLEGGKLWVACECLLSEPLRRFKTSLPA